MFRFSVRHLRVVLAFVGLLTISSTAQNRNSAIAPEISQEAAVFERMDHSARYEDDGTGVEETTAVIRVQSQAGVQAFGQLVFGYSSASEKLEVDYVRVRKADGQVVSTPVANAQDFAPEVLRQAPMYSDFRQRHVSVTSLQPGDVLEYHTITRTASPLIPHEFWYQHSFLKDVAVREEKLEINVPKNRVLKLKSPDHKWETSEPGDRRIYTWIIKESFPDRKHEREAEDVEPDYAPDVQLSTFSDWASVAQWYGRLQGQRVTVDDKIKNKADELVRGAATPAEKARRLYDYVARNVRYVSLSFGVGRFQPHDAGEVLQNGFGDCKDKHTLLQSLLRAEGIQSYPVLISSYRELDPEIPSPAQFNHEITLLELDGQQVWLDTTAEVAPYGLILYGLRNKQALVAAEGKIGGLHLTPATTPVKNQLEIAIDGKFSEVGALDASVEISARGDSEVPMRAAFRNLPQTNWPDAAKGVAAILGVAGDISNTQVESLDDTTKPLHVKFKVHQDSYFQVPNSGINFWRLPGAGVRQLAPANPKKPNKVLDVGPEIEQTYKAHLQFAPNYKIDTPSALKMSRDYGMFSISYALNKNVLDLQMNLDLHVHELPASRRSDYESFQNARNATPQVLTATIKAPSALALAEAAKVSGTPEQLHKAATLAMQRQDFTGAVDLLKRAVEADPKEKDGWDDLGHAYASLSEHEQAIAAFRKQIELDAFHKSANQDLGTELQDIGKSDDAISAYRRQLEITPFNRATHKSLGLLLAEKHQDTEAKKELETVASMPPEDPEVKMTLARLYAATGETAKSEALMKNVTGAAAGGSGTDLYASALRDDVDPNAAWREARKVLDDIGDQFDSGEFDHPGPSAFHAMDLVSLAWARTGWAKYLQGDYMEAMGFLRAAWLLSQSGTVENRMARVLEKEGQKAGVRQALALAVAAGGAEVALSREQLTKIAGAESDSLVTAAHEELLRMRTIKMPGAPFAGATARFALTFENSDKPQRVEWLEGAAQMRTISDLLREQEFPVRFPDVSSVKIVRKVSVTCEASGCVAVLEPLEGLRNDAAPSSVATKK